MNSGQSQQADLGRLGWAWEDLNLRPLPYQGKFAAGWMMPDVAGYGVYLHTLSLSVAWDRLTTVAVGS